jgi:hypothetical protein
LNSSDTLCNGEDKDITYVEFVEETVHISPGRQHVVIIPEVKKFVSVAKKLPPFRLIDHKLVKRDLNPRLPKFRVLKRQVFPISHVQVLIDVV